VTVENISDSRSGFTIAGPGARDLLAKVTRADVSADAFKFMDVKKLTVGMANCIVQRVSYTADLGYEIFCDIHSVRHLWDVLMAAGKDMGIRPFGMRAMMSLRLDKWFGSWGREFSPDYTPAETGLDRFIAWNKSADWIGKAAATAEKATGPKRKLVTMVVDAADADVVAFKLGIDYAHALGHRGASHSLVFAMACGAVAACGARWLRASAITAFLFIALSAASHALLDMLTDGGLGVALFWPWSETRHFAPWRMIEVSPFANRFFSARGVEVLLSELRWVWLPVLMLAGVAAWLRRRALP
jgi:Glycine cleavage system T protein (aminomethyltransferase)